MNPRVAVVECDPKSSQGLASLLRTQGYLVHVHPTLGRFFDALLKQRPDAVILDMQLPGMDGREILRALRSNPQTRRMILIGLSSRLRSRREVLSAFEAGADEYFFRPLDSELLAVRLRSLILRRPTPPEEEVLRYAGIMVIPERRLCLVKNDKVGLTRLEFDLLVEFLRHPRRVLTRGSLLSLLWRGDPSGERAVDRHIHALRAKLGASGRLLETVVGVGYRLLDGVLGPGIRQRPGALSGSSK